MIQGVKKAEKNVLVLDAGDLLFYKNIDPSLPSFQKNEAMMTAQLIVEAFNLMGCDAVGIGEDELRLGAKDFETVKKMAGFPFISSNLALKDGQKLASPFVVKEAGGLRWGIFSLLKSNPSSKNQPMGWKALDPVSEGQQVLRELQGKADVVVLLAAMPLNELMTLLPQLPGVTIAVAGREPSGLARPVQVGQTIVVCSPGYGRYLGILHLSIKDNTAYFNDEAKIAALERDVVAMEQQMKGGASASLKGEKKKLEADIKELKKGNTYRNEILTLSSKFQEDQAVQKLIEDFREKQKKLERGCQ